MIDLSRLSMAISGMLGCFFAFLCCVAVIEMYSLIPSSDDKVKMIQGFIFSLFLSVCFFVLFDIEKWKS